MAKLIICKRCGKKKEHCAKGLCENCYRQEWRRKNPERARAIAQRYREGHREEMKLRTEDWAKRNPEKKKAKDRRYRLRHLQQISARNRRYYREHREDLLAYQKRYRIANPKTVLAAIRRWQQANPEKMRLYESRRQTRKRALPETLTAKEIQIILSIGRCFYCSQKFPPKELTLDHFVPLVLGGGTTKANIVAACRSCNSSKRQSPPQQLLEQLMLEG